MEDSKPPETLGAQNPDVKILMQPSGSSGIASSLVFQVQENCKGMGVGSNNVDGVNVIEGEGSAKNVNAGAGIEEGALQTASNGRLVGLGDGSDEENVLEKAVREREMKEDDGVSGSNGVDSVRKFEISGDHISLYVDFSEVSKGNSDGANASGLMVSEEEPGRPGVMQELGVIYGKKFKLLVGDIVWIQTKNLSWWPGRIVGPLFAPDHVLKGEQRNCLLVGYFGDSHVAWCHPSQLRPFHLNFEQMSGRNKARSFLSAVERAVYEFGRCVKLEMTCSCILKENQHSAGKPGEMQGMAIPECKSSQLGGFSVVKFEPAEFISQLKNLAVEISKPGLLEFTVALSRLSAFYRFIGHIQLPLRTLSEVNGGEEGAATRLNVSEGEILHPNLNKDLATIPGVNVNVMSEDNGDIASGERIVLGKLSSSSKMQKRKNDTEMGSSIRIEGLDHVILPSSAEKEEVSLLPSSSMTGGIVSTKGNDDGESIINSELGLEFRERKKSKYLSYPYVNWKIKNLPSETEADQSNVSTPPVKSGIRRFQKKWYKRFISGNDMSANPQMINASSAELLSELLSTAVDCSYPVESKSFGLTEWFFSRFRISVYHGESIYETYCKNMVGQKEATAVHPSLSGNNPHNDKPTSPHTRSELNKGTPNSNPESKTPKRKRRSESETPKMKSLSGLSDVNIAINKCNLSGKDFQVMTPLTLDGEPTSASLQTKQTTNIPDLNGSGAMPISVGEDSQVLNHLASKSKKRKRKGAALEHSLTMPLPSTGLPVNGNYASFSSLMLSFEAAGPYSIGTVPEQNGKEGPTAGQPDSAGNSGPVAPDIFSLTAEGKPVKRKRKRKAKATPDLLNHLPGHEIPDLNGTSTEPSASGKDCQETNSLLPSDKPEERKKRRKRQTRLGITLSVNYDSGSTLLLTFGPGASMPSKEEVVATFSKFGPLKELETQVLEDSGSAQVVFMRTADAGEAARSLDDGNPFGATLINHQLQIHPSLPSAKPSVVPLLQPHHSEAPSLDYIKKNLEMMTSMLEKSGDNLSPEMRAKLEMEIKGLLSKNTVHIDPHFPSRCSCGSLGSIIVKHKTFWDKYVNLETSYIMLSQEFILRQDFTC
ncbi:hypothetical protein SLA2020_300430 [Shorea laevis]